MLLTPEFIDAYPIDPDRFSRCLHGAFELILREVYLEPARVETNPFGLYVFSADVRFCWSGDGATR